MALVFRNASLTYDTLTALMESNILATFFVSSEFALNNQDIITDAFIQGHAIGLAIETTSWLGASANETVGGDELVQFLQSELDSWSQVFGVDTAVPIAVKLVAFTEETFSNLVWGQQNNWLMVSIENAIAALGYTPILVPFGEDYEAATSPGADVSDVYLSNVFLPVVDAGSGYDATNAFLATRANGNLESIQSVFAATAFLGSNFGMSVVDMLQCLGGLAVN